ncbi:MAG: hypothetical protein ABI851_15815 [Saprospiraceae bacterium]
MTFEEEVLNLIGTATTNEAKEALKELSPDQAEKLIKRIQEMKIFHNYNSDQIAIIVDFKILDPGVNNNVSFIVSFEHIVLSSTNLGE